jgi:hypothetical protein
VRRRIAGSRSSWTGGAEIEGRTAAAQPAVGRRALRIVQTIGALHPILNHRRAGHCRRSLSEGAIRVTASASHISRPRSRFRQRSIPRLSRTRSPEAPARARKSPQHLGRETPPTARIPADPPSARKRQDPPLTPEVAGSSPVASVFPRSHCDRQAAVSVGFESERLLLTKGDDNTCLPARSTPSDWWPNRVEIEAAADDQP